ncbi:MAG TPA: glutaredoxin family protein [Propionibacterium sp.]|mgnify:FL=1|nr:glutaredoxin family protein [Propionibacterium sp.]
MTLPGTRVVVLTRQGCHLCDDAIAVIETVCRERDVPWQAVDVDGDAALRAQYTDHVPVTFIDGRQHAQWFLDAERFAAALG